MKLGEMCSLIRSKNAGPFTLTFDVMFLDRALYDTVRRSGQFNKRLISSIYRCSEEDVQWFECDHINSIKFSIPRPNFQGQIGDADMHGGQQFAPLLTLDFDVNIEGAAD